MMTVEKLKVVDETVKEEVETKGEWDEAIEALVEHGPVLYRKFKYRLFGKGFLVGLVTAVAIQSLVTIFILLNS